MFLYIDLSEKNTLHLKLFNQTEILSAIDEKGDYKLSEQLLFFIDTLLEKQGIQAKDLSGIVVVTGPGAFTALRLSITIATTLSQTLSIPLYGAAKDDLNTEEKIIDAASKVSLDERVIPLYDKEPNITL